MLVGRVDDLLLVSEEALRSAEAELRGATGVTVEGAAAASWAGLLAEPSSGGARVAGAAGAGAAALVIVTGSNTAA